MNPTNVQSIVVIEVNGNNSKWPTAVVTSFSLKKADGAGVQNVYHVHGVSAAQNTSNILAWLNGENYLVVNTNSTKCIKDNLLIIGPPSVLGKNAGLTAFVNGIIHTEYKSAT